MYQTFPLFNDPRMPAKDWTYELWALVASTSTFIAMVVLLIHFNDQYVLHWYSITLNTDVSALSVTIKSLLLFSVGESMGQWKWIMSVKRPDDYVAFARMDAASRGPLGSLILGAQRHMP
jgi:hypothetical protein